MTISLVLLITIALLSGLGHFTIWRLTRSTKFTAEGYATAFDLICAQTVESKNIIAGLDQRLRELETEIKLQKSDSSRLQEWLDKERAIRDHERTEYLKAMRVSERETKIQELGEALKLIKK